MRCVRVLSSVLAAAVFVPVSAWSQTDILYFTRESRIAYFEQDFDPSAVPPFSEPITFSASDAAGTMTLDTFNSQLVFPTNGTPFSDTSTGQFSRLFADAIEFSGRALAEEDATDNLFGQYTAGALSEMTVVFDIVEEVDFTLTGSTFDASRSNRPGTTTLSLTGPGVDINVSNGPIDFVGRFAPGRYTFDVFIESLGFYNDTVFGVERTRGEDLGFDALLLLVAETGIAGDYDDSGQVEQGDLNLVLNNWGQSRGFEDPGGSAFATTLVDQEELNLVLNNWGSGGVPTFEGFSVPEPAAAVLGLLGGVLLMPRKKPTD